MYVVTTIRYQLLPTTENKLKRVYWYERYKVRDETDQKVLSSWIVYQLENAPVHGQIAN
jgi:hypothetical protein